MRLFIACQIPSDIRGGLARVQLACGKLRGLKWVATDNMHITLKFLGEADDALVPEISRALLRAAKGQPEFMVEISGTGCFPSIENPKVLWAGISSGAVELRRLARDVESAMLALGYSREARPFSPHITIARLREGERGHGIADALDPFLSKSFGRFSVSGFELIKSELRREGPAYTTIDRFDLSGVGAV